MRFPIPAQPVSEREYKERLLRHAPGSLVAQIAATSGSLPDVRDLAAQGLGPYAPWALLDAAWVSLALGRDDRAPATAADLGEILGLHLALDDPVTGPDSEHRLERFLLRVAGQQFTWQEDKYAELSRTVALLVQTPHPEDLEVIRPGWDHRLLGCSVTDYIGVAQLVWAAATAHPDLRLRGRFRPAWLDDAINWSEFDLIRSSADLNTVLKRHFVTTRQKLRTRYPVGKDPRLRRYAHNPLRARPLVGGFKGGYFVPVPAAVLGKASPLGLYYTGGDGGSEQGQAFTRDLGHLFERYVGRQLGLLPDAEVHPEIRFRLPKKQSGTSVDWIVVFPNLVLLVEVKSTRPGEPLRLGAANFTDILNDQLGKAFDQINKSVKRISSGDHPEFGHIPRDRTMLGMVITAEHFHQINTPELRAGFPPADIPVTVASIHELEQAVTLTGTSLADLLLASAAQRGTTLRELFPAYEFLERNEILEKAWKAIPLTRDRHR
ncbi:MAG TPA: nuclease-related domain-containing protein [Streptomyces sp.]